MELFIIIALLITLSAFYSYFNARLLKLPGTIGVLAVAITGSVLIIAANQLAPGLAKTLTQLAKSIDFSESVLNIMLGFLLFATAFRVDTRRLRREMKPVMVLSTLGVLLSTAIFGLLFHFTAQFFDIRVPFVYCFLFGALISPTDPVAVEGIIKGSKLPQHLETIVSGESLLNDGVGLVLFVIITEIARTGTESIVFSDVLTIFIQEVFGGIALGVISGFIAFRLMRSISDFQTIVLVSLALVMADSVIASVLHLSIPIAVVTAGLFAGSRSIDTDAKQHSHQSLEKFWELIDEMLNTVLFSMIGLQMINFPFIDNYWRTGTIAILVLLVARWLSIVLPLTFLRRSLNINYGSVNVLTWAGVRGGISIALALSLQIEARYKYLIIAATFFVVIFSVIFQGLTLKHLINYLYRKADAK